MTSALDTVPITAARRRAAAALACALEHPAVVYVAGLSVGSRRTTIQCIRRAAAFFHSSPSEWKWQAMGYAHMNTLRAWLHEKYAPATVHTTMTATRGVLRTCVRMKLMDRGDMFDAIDVEPVRGSREPAGRALELAELEALFACCEDTPTGKRDAAILALFYGAALRRSELCSLQLANVRTRDQGGPGIVCIGKGNKERFIPLPDTAARRLDAWLSIRGDAPGHLFFARVGPCSQNFREQRLGTSGAYHLLTSLAERAGLAHFTPHDLRRTYAGDMLDAGVDLKTVQDLMGHATPLTTARYDRRGVRAKQDAAARLDARLRGAAKVEVPGGRSNNSAA